VPRLKGLLAHAAAASRPARFTAGSMPGRETARTGRSRGGCTVPGGPNVAATYETLQSITERCRECWPRSIYRVD
jgi:hypothetical protein